MFDHTDENGDKYLVAHGKKRLFKKMLKLKVNHSVMFGMILCHSSNSRHHPKTFNIRHKNLNHYAKDN